MLNNSYTKLRETIHMQLTLCPHNVPCFFHSDIDLTNFHKLTKKARPTAYWTQAFSRALKKHPRVNAGFLRQRFVGGPAIVAWDEVSAAISVDKKFGEERFPFSAVLRNSDQLSLAEINERLDYFIKQDVSNIKEFEGFLKFSNLPRWMKKFLMRQMTYSPEKLISKIGTFSITNPGKWGPQSAGTHSPRLLVCLGAPKDNVLPVTYNFNHIITDGAQIGEFHQDVKTIIENVDFF
jgi:pyruvate/2-oxoglutarate dehydrogenase complex dihydrolipoamide acyltransferase (E2) component